MAADQQTKGNTAAEEKNRQEPSKTRDGNKKKKSPGLFSFLLPILFAISIILGIWGYFIKTNKFGLGERFRNNLKDIPIVRMILPPSPDPAAAEYMSADQLASKYEEFRKKVKDQQKTIDDQKKTISELQPYKSKESYLSGQNENLRSYLEQEKKRIEQERKQLKNDKLKFATVVKNADKNGFADYYEKMDKDTAQKVYEQIVKERMLSNEVKKYVQTFEAMEPASAAKVLENMGVGNMDLVANIMKQIKKQAAAEILANMDSVFAANLADTMAVEYPIYPEE